MDVVNLGSASEQERLSYGRQVAALRKAKGWSMEQLAARSGVNRKTIGHMEQGKHAAQAEKLRLVFQALGVPTETERYSGQIEGWLAMLGKLIERVDEPAREEAVNRAVAVLVEYMVRAGSPEEAAEQVAEADGDEDGSPAERLKTLSADELATVRTALQNADGDRSLGAHHA